MILVSDFAHALACLPHLKILYNQYMKKLILSLTYISAFIFAVLFIFPSLVSAHCDSIDGPVVNAARRALKTENVNFVLIWVKPEDEEEIRRALKRARDKWKKAKTDREREEADMEFFETLVKVHREGEGAGYEGIKPAGSVGKEIALADRAVEKGNLDEVLKAIPLSESREIVMHLFKELKEKSDYNIDDLNAGREFVESYAQFIHGTENALKGVNLKMDAHHTH